MNEGNMNKHVLSRRILAARRIIFNYAKQISFIATNRALIDCLS